MPSPLTENTCVVPSINVSVPFPQVKSKPPLGGTVELIFNDTRPANHCTPPACPSTHTSTAPTTKTSNTRDRHIMGSSPLSAKPGRYSLQRASVGVMHGRDRAHFLSLHLPPL